MTQAYPLTWPKEWPRTMNPEGSRFDTTISKAMNNVTKSLEMFAKDSGKKVESIVVSSNVTLGAQNPKDAGVAIYFTWDGISTCIAVDRYRRVEENLQAIHHCVEAERTKLRHGGLNLVRAAFRGYAALPPPSAPSGRNWTDVLGLTSRCTREDIENSYKAKAKKAHPDTGGSTEAMAELNAARAQALKEHKP